jgi:hypothetical protein
MKFTCNQDWDSMTPKIDGKFCGLCQKSVTDYTNSSFETISKEHKAKDNVCGLYNIEQVDSDILYPVKDVFSNRFLVFITSLTIGLTTKTIQAQVNTPKIEQHQTTDTIITNNTETIKKHICDKNCDCNKSIVKYNSKRKRNRRKLYFSKRFPFIKYRRQRLMGRLL